MGHDNAVSKNETGDQDVHEEGPAEVLCEDKSNTHIATLESGMCIGLFSPGGERGGCILKISLCPPSLILK